LFINIEAIKHDYIVQSCDEDCNGSKIDNILSCFIPVEMRDG